MILICRRNMMVEKAIELNEEDIVIGRSKDADLVLEDREVSKTHAKITFEDNKYFIEDLGSSNGLYLGKSKVLRTELSAETPVEVGPFQLLLASDEDTLMSISEDVLSKDEKTQLNQMETFQEESFSKKLDVHPSSSDEEVADETQATETPPKPKEKVLKARLVQLDGDEEGRTIELNEEEVTLGIEDTADIEVNSEEDDSFEMAKILRRKDQFFFEDAKTIVNPDMQDPLENKQEIQIGDHKFRFEQTLATPTTKSAPTGVQERTRPSTPRKWQPYLRDWRFLLITSLVASFLLVALFQGDRSNPSQGKESNQVGGEMARLERYHLDRARSALEGKDFAVALAAVNQVLEGIAPNSEKAQSLKEKILFLQAQAQAKEEKKRKLLEANKEEVERLLQTGSKALEEEDVSTARTAFGEILRLNANHEEARQGLKKADELEKAIADAKQKEKAYNEKLTRNYELGVSAFEEGNYKKASELLKPISRRKGHQYQASAKNLLRNIQKRSAAATKEKVIRAQTLAEAGELLTAYEELKLLQKTFPKNEDVDKAMKKIREQMHLKAKDLYTKGIASEELLEDISAALDYYKEALQYAPEPEDEYFRKANEKINKLEIAP